MKKKFALFIIFAIIVIGGGYLLTQQFLLPKETSTPPANKTLIKSKAIASGLKHPWALVPLPDGRFLVSERAGNLRYVAQDGSISVPITGLPEIYHAGQGGLLDIILHPDFANNKTIFFSYAEAEEGKAGTAVARAKLNHTALEDVVVIFRQHPKMEGDKHFGSRLVFTPKGNLFIGLGERFDYYDQAQKLDNHLGKIVRVSEDGKVPDDNPFVNTVGALPEIWSFGHRNIQGAGLHPKTERLWVHEHGPRGGDEINIPEAGKNYGWPEASYGIHYWMVPIESDHEGRGFEEPIHHWTPSIAPSSMIFYTGDRFPELKGNLLIGALAGKHLARLVIEDSQVVYEERLLTEKAWRIRDIAQSDDGAIYILTDEKNGKLLELFSETP